MREIDVKEVARAVEELCIEACYDLPEDVLAALEAAREAEESEVGREILDICIENARVAREQRVPICQDTGVTVVYLEVGQDVHLTGGDVFEAVTEGVRRGYDRGYLRKSVVDDPLFTRKNTGDNTPPIVYTDIVPGDRLKVTVVPKGTGSENMSALKMLTPAAGVEGVKRFIVETVDRAGSNPCPPVIVGVGVGGMMDKAAYLAKKALVRPVGRPHPQPEVARLERETLEEINKLGIGPQGLGGRTTALAVHIETHPTHIGALPVAVNIQCHAARHAERVL
ncbi:MAG TPA: fumarate hydratase [Clostridiales bacterium]|nr:fumarate hydratase [Clostridiales bacterium]